MFVLKLVYVEQSQSYIKFKRRHFNRCWFNDWKRDFYCFGRNFTANKLCNIIAAMLDFGWNNNTLRGIMLRRTFLDNT